MDLKERITGYWESGHPALFLLSHEETRVEDILKTVVADMAARSAVKKRDVGPQLLRWSVTKGWHNADGELVALKGGTLVVPKTVQEQTDAKQAMQEPRPALEMMKGFPEFTIAVLKDFHPYMDDPVVLRAVRDLALMYKGTTCRMAVFLSSRLPTLGMRETAALPAEIQKSVTLVDFPLPEREELGKVLDEIVAQNSAVKAPSAQDRDRLLEAGSGMTTIEFENSVALAWLRHKAFGAEAAATVYQEKAAVVKQSGALECVLQSGVSMADVGGLDLLKGFFRERQRAFTKEAREFGVDPPKGVLLVGEPGTGKTYSGKAVATMLGLPMLKMDAGALFGSYVGESERNTRDALKMAEAMAPCLLLIDEIEKGIGMASAAGITDSGVSSRVVATILSWLQERTRPVFVVATANRVEKIPAELMRLGRFDAVFYVSFPSADERAEIARIHLRKRGRAKLKWATDEAMAELAKRMEKDGCPFSGAEIEEVVKRGLLRAFCADRELVFADLIKAAGEISPLSMTAADQIEATRTHLAGRAQPASLEAPDLRPKLGGDGGRKIAEQ